MDIKNAIIGALLVALVLVAGVFYYFYVNKTSPSTTPPLATDPTQLVIAWAAQSVSKGFDPALAGGIEGLFIRQCYSGLVTTHGADVNTFYPDLAESWDVSSDGRTWTFHIRHNLTFPSGTPLTASAFVTTFNRFINVSGGNVYFMTSWGIKSDTIKAVDDYTLTVTTDKAYNRNLMLSQFSTYSFVVMDPAAIAAHINEGKLGSDWFTYHTAGIGPFYLDNWQRGVGSLLKANAAYWAGAPKLKEIVIKEIQDAATQAMMLQKGEIDVAIDLLPSTINSILKGNMTDIQATTYNQMWPVYIAMNLNGTAPLNDVKVRQAIAYSINYTAIAALVDIAGAQSQSVIPPYWPHYNPYAPYSQNITKAKQLLAEAGYPNGFELEILSSSFWYHEQPAEIIQANLAQVGITVNIKVLDYASVMQNMRTRNFKGICFNQWAADVGDVDTELYSHAYASDPPTSGTVPYRCTWINTNLSKLVSAERTETNETLRDAQIMEIQKIMLDDAVIIPLFHRRFLVAYRSWVEGFYFANVYFHTHFADFSKATVYTS